MLGVVGCEDYGGYKDMKWWSVRGLLCLAGSSRKKPNNTLLFALYVGTIPGGREKH